MKYLSYSIILLLLLLSCTVYHPNTKRKVDPYTDSIFKKDILPFIVKRLEMEEEGTSKYNGIDSLIEENYSLDYIALLSGIDLVTPERLNPIAPKKDYHKVLKWYEKYKYKINKDYWLNLDSIYRFSRIKSIQDIEIRERKLDSIVKSLYQNE